MMAASLFSSIPVTVMFIFLQKYFISGLTSGAVKG
jgi:ABC-type maltose transport system permease subunit